MWKPFVNSAFSIAVDSLFMATITEMIKSVPHGTSIPWDDAPINPGGNFDISLRAYVAPVNGYYQ